MSLQSTAIGAIGAVLGYIGAEGATPAPFERLLWPQRTYAGFSWRHVFHTALLSPAGGPVYKATLQVLDNASSSGLLRGPGLGSMLGTAFFPKTGSIITMHNFNPGVAPHTSSARNCIWERVITLLPVPKLAQPLAKQPYVPKALRAQVAVHHLLLAVCKSSATTKSTLSVSTDSGRTPIQSLAGLVVSEFLGIFLAVLVTVLWHSWLAVLWLLPLCIKLLSAATALDRDDLLLPSSTAHGGAVEQHQDFEVHMPMESGTHLLITGPSSLVLQFFRHFGHPKRDRARELIQLSLVVASGLLFPLGLILSVTIMLAPLQYAWISYQLYLALTMYISRYLAVNLWSSTEELIAQRLASNPAGVFLWGNGEDGLVVRAELESTFHERYSDAKLHFAQLLKRPR